MYENSNDRIIMSYEVAFPHQYERIGNIYAPIIHKETLSVDLPTVRILG